MTAAFSPEQFGPYLLLSHLGRGGMADVFKARVEGAKGFARLVVVKRILKVHTAEPHFVEMFINEAKIAARLSHPNIAQVYELGEVGDELFMAMEYVRGQDLLRVMRAAAIRGEAVPPPVIGAYIVREVARALSHAHEHTDENGAPRPIIHRDVSPQNVMIGYDGQVKLVDFGIAKAVTAFQEVTHTGSLKGKFGYMAPEQIDTGVCTAQTDIFSAGVVLHEVLTGRRLFKGQTDYDTMSRVKQAPLLPPSSVAPGINAALDRVVMAAIDRDPARRYARAAQLARELDEVLLEARFQPEDMKAWLLRILPPGERDEAQGDSQMMPLGHGTPSRSRPGGATPRPGSYHGTPSGTPGSYHGTPSATPGSHHGTPSGTPHGTPGGAGSTGRGGLRPLIADQGASLGDMAGASWQSALGGEVAGRPGAEVPTERRPTVGGRRPLVFGVVVLLFLGSLGGVFWLLRPAPSGPVTGLGTGVGTGGVTRPPVPTPVPTPVIRPGGDEGPAVAGARPMQLQLQSNPSGALVYEGPRLLGRTPLMVELATETRDVVLSYQGRPELRYTLRRAEGSEVVLRLPDADSRHGRHDRRKGRDLAAVPDAPPVETPVATPPVVPPVVPRPPPPRLKVKIVDEEEHGKPIKPVED